MWVLFPKYGAFFTLKHVAENRKQTCRKKKNYIIWNFKCRKLITFNSSNYLHLHYIFLMYLGLWWIPINVSSLWSKRAFIFYRLLLNYSLSCCILTCRLSALPLSLWDWITHWTLPRSAYKALLPPKWRGRIYVFIQLIKSAYHPWTDR